MITILYPWALLALILPLVVHYVLPTSKNFSRGLKIYFFKDMVAQFGTIDRLSNLGNDNGIFRRWRFWALIILYILIVISAMGISIVTKSTPINEAGRNILLAVDLSGSMQTPDMSLNGVNASRLDIVKRVALNFIQARKGDRIGLILFGTRPYLQTPLTFDRNVVADTLDDATIGIAGNQTAIGDAIALAVKQLEKYPESNRALVLLTDGGNDAGSFDPIDAAKIASKENIKIYTIGIGARSMQINTILGPRIINPSNDLDIVGLQKIANMTGGKFFRAEDGSQLQNIYSQINQLEPIKLGLISVKVITPLYPWILGIALLLIFIIIASLLYSNKKLDR
jgi:Ca-activated chloride channel family protein